MPDARHLSHAARRPLAAAGKPRSVRRGTARLSGHAAGAALNAAAPARPCICWRWLGFTRWPQAAWLPRGGAANCGPPRRRSMGLQPGGRWGLGLALLLPRLRRAPLQADATPGQCCQPSQPSFLPVTAVAEPFARVAGPPAPRCCRACPGCRAQCVAPGCRPVEPLSRQGAAVLAGCTDARRCCRQRPDAERLRVLVVGAMHGDELTAASLALRWIGMAAAEGGGRGRASAPCTGASSPC